MDHPLFRKDLYHNKFTSTFLAIIRRIEALQLGSLRTSDDFVFSLSFEKCVIQWNFLRQMGAATMVE